MEFKFQGWPDLDCSVTEQGLDVAAMNDGECWDLLLSLDVVPIDHGGEWGCEICDKEGRPDRFKTRGALWRNHLFDQLEEWIVERLAAAAEVEYHKFGTGSTWARLA